MYRLRIFANGQVVAVYTGLNYYLRPIIIKGSLPYRGNCLAQLLRDINVDADTVRREELGTGWLQNDGNGEFTGKIAGINLTLMRSKCLLSGQYSDQTPQFVVTLTPKPLSPKIIPIL